MKNERVFSAEIKKYIKLSGVRFVLGLVLGVLVLFICMRWYHSPRRGLFYAAIFLMLGVISFFPSKPKFWGTVIHLLFNGFFLLYICTVAMDLPTGLVLSILPFSRLLLNFLVVFIVYAIFIVLSGNHKASFLLTALVLMVMGIINYYVYYLRGKEFTVTDILAAQTVLNVIGNYNLLVPADFFFKLVNVSLILWASFCFPSLSLSRAFRGRLIWAFITVVSTLALVLFSKNAILRNWNLDGSVVNGFFLNFYLSIRDSAERHPDGYSVKAVNDISSEFDSTASGSSTPDIIVIMNETFSELDVFQNQPPYSKPVTPFISSMKENTVKGHTLVSVFAGNTANSEYEFLSGHTMAFFPNPLSVTPFQSYIHDNSFSLAWLMKSLGYSTFATHPNYPSSWTRDKAYPRLGFDASSFIDEYPKTNLIRNWVSDQEMYEFMLDKLASDTGDSPLFLFGVTMQNHGGYEYVGPNYAKNIELKGIEGSYPLAEQWLSLIYESDKAVEYLITELEKREEDTVVVFFGDHMPGIEENLYSELNGGPLDTLDEQMLKFTVPFFIWANYDIEEYTLEKTSLNYLAGHLLDIAGIELPPYFKFLRETEEIIPAINSLGYYSLEQGRMLSLEEAEGEEAQAIERYRFVQFNDVFDTKNRDELFFGQFLPAG